MTKDEIKAELDDLNIEYDDSMKKAELEALLPEEDESGEEISVGDEEELDKDVPESEEEEAEEEVKEVDGVKVLSLKEVEINGVAHTEATLENGTTTIL